jgi:UDP-glucuronate 4-epimerase
MRIIVTGAAGFIGFHTCLRLIKCNFEVIGIDNINNYYDKNLKLSRLNLINELAKRNKSFWKFFKATIEDEGSLSKIFKNFEPEVVIHLAAQAGVRYSIKRPREYLNSNLIGFFNILELCRK